MTQRWTAIILAGQRPGIDPLAAHFGTEWKALVDIHGEPMLTHVVRTLCATAAIKQIIVLAQEPDSLHAAVVAGGGADAIWKSEASLSNSVATIIGSKVAWPILVTTADHPLLTPEIVTQFLREAEGADLSVGFVEKQDLLNRFPINKRTWLKFADGHWSGANLFALTSNRVIPALNLWAAAEADRKVPWKLFRHFGPWLMLRALSRTIGLKDGLAAAGRRLGLTARLVKMADPVAAIDVDKPTDHALAEQIMAQRRQN